MENLEILTSTIEDIIENEVYLRDVPYKGPFSDGEMETDPDSIRNAATKIVKMLVEQGHLK